MQTCSGNEFEGAKKCPFERTADSRCCTREGSCADVAMTATGETAIGAGRDPEEVRSVDLD